MLPVIVFIHAHAVHAWARHRARLEASDRGQTTAEYALVLLGAAAIALLIIAWTAKSNRIGKLLDTILDTIMSKVQ